MVMIPVKSSLFWLTSIWKHDWAAKGPCYTVARRAPQQPKAARIDLGAAHALDVGADLVVILQVRAFLSTRSTSATRSI